MSRINSKRSNCKDVFNAFLVCMASFAGLFEFPVIAPTYQIPNRLIPFSKAVSSKDYNCWIHFYEDDYLFERLWRNPQRYLELLRKFNGIILPDFSLYRDMPLVMQLWNIYRSRAIGAWLQTNGIMVIPNIRYGDRRTYKCCSDGISKGCVIAIGTHGTIKNRIDRKIFIDGLDVVINHLNPKAIIVYGAAPDYIFKKYRDSGIEIYSFISDYGASIKKKEVS